ncbi:Glycine-rich domain-containing protein-like [Fragilaria crotonensis]|nr:Glycine-rich domain-containing protein-like [Fragilaria crotonensis]
MSLSCDLAQNARKHKEFLERLHELGVTIATVGRKPYDSLRSLYRYQHLWLPLVHKHSNEDLVPPPDVAWLWHCHRLAPRSYVAYVKDTFGDRATLEAKPPFSFQIPDTFDDDSSTEATTRGIWKNMYSNEPFFLSDSQEESPSPTLTGLLCDGRGKSVDLLSGFDLLASTERQACFLWQVSGERFCDDDFLTEGVKNYIKFLLLTPKARKLQSVLVPTYQIDLMWHTHILSSIGDYNKDCIAIMGQTFHHDDSLTDRSDGGVLDIAYKATAQLWREEYNSEYVVCGGMYRGEPPKAYFSKDWNSLQDVDGAGANLHSAGLVGASSTLPPAKWAKPWEYTSDGKPAFLAEAAALKNQLKSRPRKEGYVLGKTTYGTGYYHMETKQAHEILLKRAEKNVRVLESEIAMAMGCCPRSPEWLQEQEVRLNVMREARDVLARRVGASRPVGNVVGRSPNSSSRYEHDGVWLYPPFLFASAGGACGGTVACGPSACGGSACAGGDSGGGGGGGFGGGGCGGGGCGGGGCGGGGGG